MMRKAGLLLTLLLLLVDCAGPSGAGTSNPPPRAVTSPALTPATATSPSETPKPVPAAGWPMFGRDAMRSGDGPATPVFKGAASAWTATLDQQVFAQPLYAGGKVIAVTENNTVYALDPGTGTELWKAHFGDPIRGSTLPCGSIDPSGITSTPIVDETTGTIYTVAYLPPFHHELYALDIASGAVRWHLTIDPPTTAPRVLQQRGALSLANGRVYVPFGGLNGDCDNYRGWVMGVAADGRGPLLSYQVPTNREGGIWATGGMAQDSAGYLYAAIGNAASTTAFDFGNAVVRLDADLKVASYWAPSDWAALSRADADIGSITPLLLPGGLVFQAGKAGVGYLLRQSALGGIGGEVFAAPVCKGGSFAAAAFSAGIIYVPCGGGIVALTLGSDRFDIAWRAGGSWPPIVAYGSVWTLAGSTSATLLQLDPATGAVRSRTVIGDTNHFCTPSAAAGHLFVPAGNRILAFGPPA